MQRLASRPTGRPADGRRVETPNDGSTWPEEDVVERIMEQVRELSRLQRARLGREIGAELGGYTLHQLEALAFLLRHEATMHELSEEMGIATSAATALADKLVARGAVERVSDPHDRRVVRLRVTDGVRALAARFTSLRREQGRRLLARLDRPQLVAFEEILAELCRSAASDSAWPSVPTPRGAEEGAASGPRPGAPEVSRPAGRSERDGG
jgi:DNA-binding MarR family transcriptional regulator